MAEPLSPRQRYARELQRDGFSADPAQARAVEALQLVYDALLEARPKRRLGKLRWPAVPGLYLWGSVGRGKTWLMDAFHESLPFTRKRRTHFYRFMLEVHARRAQHADEQDPIARVAEDVAAETRVLCFDEFFVSDIADAMILGRLTEVLFERGVTLVATSNVAPRLLYSDGLQRERFVPAIQRIEQHCKVLHLDSPNDYRLRALTQAEIYHHPSDAAAEANLRAWFRNIAQEDGRQGGTIHIEGREIAVRQLADGVAWFDFATLCATARSAADYIELARTHHTLLVSKVPQLTPHDEDTARRFVTMVDELYDRGVKLILAAAVPREHLYAGKKLAFEFQRTLSRLQEMQSQEYLSRPHLP
ncbi:MAG TPA: cell division protein ZapE [Verrucomicrobiae bacterium]|nr:cell division protein ZapE [Verrucomicrobiae bacterium]